MGTSVGHSHRVAGKGLLLLDGAYGVGVASPIAARVKNVARGALRAVVGVHALRFVNAAKKVAVETS